ncbi:MAG: rhodanese-like domain-containing protein [Candidatus Aminicenantes bacterium]|nr:rhodanese-like domain-containing protein [Candidatus Aminicenantes bacterium]
MSDTSNLSTKKIRTILIFIIAITGLLPILLYRFSIGRVPSVSVTEAVAVLNKTGTKAILIDVRSPESFHREHIDGSINWPLKKIKSLRPGDSLPEHLKDASLFLICEGGISSALAAQKLINLKLTDDVASVNGGLQEWKSGIGEPFPEKFSKLRVKSGDVTDLPFRESSLFEQIALTVAAFGIKPVYMILSLLLVFVLMRSRLPDLVALRWGLLAFFTGEACCAVNYLFFHENSLLVEYLHMFGMVLAFGFTTYAILEAMDIHLIHYSEKEKKCAALSLCASCYKNKDVACGIERIFKLLILIFIFLSCLPLLALPYPASYTTRILKTLYQSIHPAMYQVYEIRLAPIIAVILFIIAFIVIQGKGKTHFHLARIFFCSGMGFLGFSLFRLILFSMYRENLVWFAFWEEFTELLYTAGAGFVILVFFDRILEKDRKTGRHGGKV